MNMKIKKLILAGVVWAAALTVGISWFNQTPAFASDASDLTNAQKNAPAGLPLSEYFQFGTFTTSAGTGNSAKVIDTNRSDGTQMVDLTDNTNQLGTIWTGDDYRMNMMKDATASMWLNFGGKTSSSADGMAFVLQNDSRGVDATATTSTGQAATGETMGVWGADDVVASNSSGIAGRAIQNSWAIEFDTNSNSQGTLGSSFDKGITAYPHIAAGYPAETSTYTTAPEYTMLEHGNYIANNKFGMLSDGSWHHLTLKWTASTQQMTYSFDDKNTDGSDKAAIGTRTATIDLGELGVSVTSPYVRWGFTGSTGKNSEVNLAIFEQLPGIVNSDATATITDTTQGAEVTSGLAVNANDRLRLDYKLNYDSGSQDWKNIVAGLNIPSSLTPTSAKVTYADGTVEEIGDENSIGSVDLTSYKLKKNLNDSNNIATISVETVAQGSTSGSTSVAAAKSTFNGSNALASATTPAFTINKALTSSMTLALTSDSSVSATAGSDVTVTGNITILGSKPTKVTLHPTLNGTALDSQDQTSTSGFSYTVPADKLTAGKNVLTIYASDNVGDVSANSVQVTITLGNLDWTVGSSALSYEAVLTGSSTTVAPSSFPDIEISDTRGSGSTWSLKAAMTTPLTSATDGSTYPGELIYQNGDGSSTMLDSSDVTITSSGSGSANVADGWDKTWTGSQSKGMFLQVPSDATQNDYAGKITWTLEDGPA